MNTPVKTWTRIANYFLDKIFALVIVSIINYFTTSTVFAGQIASAMIFNLVLFLLYYVVSESLWQKTLAKFITKTKVVMRDGSIPPFANILGRSLARMIPFDNFSFLVGAYPIGWHDSLSNTIVVPSTYTEDDVKKIDFAALEKEKAGKATIIAIIVVAVLVGVAITGILSSVALVSLNSARTKGHDITTRSNISMLRSSLEIYSAKAGNYGVAINCSTGPFADPSISSLISVIPTAGVNCFAQKDTYAVSAVLQENQSTYCVDNTGYAGSGLATFEKGKAYCNRATTTQL
jgi:uncharacterized RDD family membrane protein YckC